MGRWLEEEVQRGQRSGEDGKPLATHHCAIVDEVDNILIDEARTPLIISGAPEQAAELYVQFAKLARTLRRARSPRGWTRRPRRSSSPTTTTSSTRSTRRCRSPSRASRRPSASCGSTTS